MNRSRATNGTTSMRYALLFIAAVLFAASASAEEYERGPNGGLMLDVTGIDVELPDRSNAD